MESNKDNVKILFHHFSLPPSHPPIILGWGLKCKIKNKMNENHLYWEYYAAMQNNSLSIDYLQTVFTKVYKKLISQYGPTPNIASCGHAYYPDTLVQTKALK